MSYPAVRNLLSAPVYVGRPGRRGADVLGRPQGRWPALIDDGIWQRVQERVSRHQHMPRQASGRYLLTGVVRCPKCGTRMTGYRANPRQGHGNRYRCAGRLLHNCQWGLPAPPADAAVLSEVCTVIEVVASTDTPLDAALRRAWHRLQDGADGDSSDAIQRIRHLEREAERSRQRLTDAAVLLVDGEMDRDGYELLRGRARADLDAAERELASLARVAPEQQLPSLELVLGESDNWQRALRGADMRAQREVLGGLIDYVVPYRVGYRQYAVGIVWNELGEALQRLARALRDEAAI